jgi:predicted MFS family arabinose efflux permease
MDRRLTLLFAVAVGMIVGNMYYIQPLMGAIAGEMGVSEASLGVAATLGAVGQTLGMLCLLPLGDAMERRRLILGSLLVSAAALLAVAVAPNVAWLCVGVFLLGFFTVATHLLVSLGATLAEPERRGRVVGTIMSGLLTGLLLARVFSGFVGAYAGWRVVFVIAAAAIFGLFVVLYRAVPSVPPASGMRYRELLLSMWRLFRDEWELRECCAFGALTFGAFGAFWVTLAFHLEQPPFFYGPRAAGLFGLLGVAGALAASGVGRLADRMSARDVCGLFMPITLASFVVLWLGGASVWGLALGVVLLDFGLQAIHVCNQTRVYGLLPEARNRLAAVYMVTYFAGGALGSAHGKLGWTRCGWTGVCLAGGGLIAAATLVYLSGQLRRG